MAASGAVACRWGSVLYAILGMNYPHKARGPDCSIRIGDQYEMPPRATTTASHRLPQQSSNIECRPMRSPHDGRQDWPLGWTRQLIHVVVLLHRGRCLRRLL